MTFPCQAWVDRYRLHLMCRNHSLCLVNNGKLLERFTEEDALTQGLHLKRFRSVWMDAVVVSFTTEFLPGFCTEKVFHGGSSFQVIAYLFQKKKESGLFGHCFGIWLTLDTRLDGPRLINDTKQAFAQLRGLKVVLVSLFFWTSAQKKTKSKKSNEGKP